MADTPLPGQVPTPPTSTARPRNTLVDYAEATQQLVETGQQPRPELVEAKTAVNRLGRLEERADRADGWRLEINTWREKIDKQLAANNGATFKNLSLTQITAFLSAVSAAFLFVSQVLGEWGNQNPGAKVGVFGAIVGLAQVVNRVRAANAAKAAKAEPKAEAAQPVASGAEPASQGPPPGHT